MGKLYEEERMIHPVESLLFKHGQRYHTSSNISRSHQQGLRRKINVAQSTPPRRRALGGAQKATYTSNSRVLEETSLHGTKCSPK